MWSATSGKVPLYSWHLPTYAGGCAVQGWTPLHVAVLLKNRQDVVYLSGPNVGLSQKEGTKAAVRVRWPGCFAACKRYHTFEAGTTAEDIAIKVGFARQLSEIKVGWALRVVAGFM